MTCCLFQKEDRSVYGLKMWSVLPGLADIPFSQKDEWLRKGCYLDLWVIKNSKLIYFRLSKYYTSNSILVWSLWKMWILQMSEGRGNHQLSVYPELDTIWFCRNVSLHEIGIFFCMWKKKKGKLVSLEYWYVYCCLYFHI